MNEAQFKGKFVKFFRTKYPSLVIFRHEDQFTAGIPDISITRSIRTLWLEAKVTPGEKVGGIQDETLRRLGGYYIVYNQIPRTYTVCVPRTGEVLVEGDFASLTGFVSTCLML